VKAERRSLEDVALPVAAEEAGEEHDDSGGDTDGDGGPRRSLPSTGRFKRTTAPPAAHPRLTGRTYESPSE
jgi:hypothetical protein